MKAYLSIKRIFLFTVLLLGSSVGRCQIYKYIGLEDGLSNQKIYHIQKDRRGYMWFLTQEGIDRYDGKRIKHYNFSDDSMKLDSRIALNWLYMDSKDVLWVIGQKGRVFQYDSQHDKFELAYVHPELVRNKSQAFLNYGYLDKNDRIWLCYKDSIAWYDIRTGNTLHMPTPINSEIAAIEQTDDNHFFIGTVNGLFYAEVEKGRLNRMSDKAVESIRTSVHELYYHAVSKQLFVGNYKEGILVYDVGKTGKIIPCQLPNNVEINRIVALNDHELLVATGGRGVYKLDVNTCMSEPYITADYNSYNGMNGNNINDIYVDEEERIWLANYPTGITIRNNRYGSYDLIRHSIGNSLSLVNDQVHDVLEDSDGDLWFATSNGISLYQTDTKEWQSFLSSFESVPDNENHIFLTLCEVSPGVIWAGGFMSGICKIEKRKGFKIGHIAPATIAGVRPDQYIFDIKKDSDGDVWSGGYYHLKRINLETGSVRLYPGVSSITTILEKNVRQMWIGTRMGLYRLDKKSGDYQYVNLPVESPYICSLYQRDGNVLYIGTRGAGLLVYDIGKKKFIHQYRTDNCALISDNIYTILPRQDGSLLMGTENGITIYSPSKHTFRNWTREQGLMSVNFNVGSATTYSKNTLVFGGNICATFRKYAELKHVDFIYESNFDYLNVWFDSDKMGSILKNVLSNALKYTPEGGSIRIYAREEGNSWSIEVKDTGIGIPSCEQKKLFRNCFRGSNVINLKVTGSGIGLMLVYKLVRLHKGRIQIQSTEHQGTCVLVVFPKGNSHLHKVKFISPRTPYECPEAIMPGGASGLPSVEISQERSLQRVLIVEDNDDLRNYLIDMFKTDYYTQSCPNGKEALAIIREFNPVLVISDIMMPELGGDKLCSTIKGDLETSHIPVILLTALGDEKNMLEGLAIGADAYITKPFSVGILKATVKNILTNRALLRQFYNCIEDKEQNLPVNCTGTLDWKFIASVKECIEDNMGSPDFNVDLLSSRHHMSRTSFFNKLKALTGYAPADYIRMIRLQHAAQLLKQGEHTVTEIADMVGFSDAKYFREVFKKYYNVSPSKFNKKSEN